EGIPVDEVALAVVIAAIAIGANQVVAGAAQNLDAVDPLAALALCAADVRADEVALDRVAAVALHLDADAVGEAVDHEPSNRAVAAREVEQAGSERPAERRRAAVQLDTQDRIVRVH